MEIQLQEALATTRRMAEILAHHTHQPIERVEHDIDRDFYMTAEEARAYGIVDDIIAPRRGVAALAAAAAS
jgi:ATP-dependent Clp protease protease subunit